MRTHKRLSLFLPFAAILVLVLLFVALSAYGQSGLSGDSGLSGLVAPTATAMTNASATSAALTATANAQATANANATATANANATATANANATATANAQATADYWATATAQAPHAYYFDATGGNDSTGAGTQASPWQTISKASGLTLNPGDQVLFKAGQIWSNSHLTPAHSGSAGSPITYGRYSTGANPQINSTSGASSIDIAGQSWLVFDGIDSQAGGYHNYSVVDSHDIKVRNADITGTSAHNSAVDNVSTGTDTVYNILYERLTIHDLTTGWGITGGGVSNQNITIKNCNIHNIGSGTSPQEHNIYFGYTHGLTITGSVIHDGFCENINLRNGCTGVRITDNIMYNSGFNGSMAYDGGHGVFAEAGCVVDLIQNNLIYDSYYNTAINLAGQTAPCAIIGNTIARARNGLVVLPAGANGWVIKNNALIMDNAWDDNNWHCPLILLGGDADIANNTFDNNLYWYKHNAGAYDPIRSATDTYPLATWQGKTSSPDVHSLAVNPLFVTAYTDFHPQSGSPLRGAGASGVGATYDVFSVTRGSPPDIGAVQYVP